ncbi:MAG: homocysteine S-methyltransferase family protein, partial [Lachnospiraceae bacterium]|nr:homocysteine S-methyltransferase family protein [Lachnospiraceae bacterium]
RLFEINERLVKLSKKAAGSKAYVAGDITMTGRQLFPMGDMDFEELVKIYKEQIEALSRAGADLLVIETMMSLNETRAALIAAKETCSLPVMATLTFEADGRTLFGTDPETAMIVLQSLGADAVGANCSTGPEQMAQVIKKMHSVAQVPVIAKPNAGLPRLDENGNTVYDMDPSSFGEKAAMLVEAGAVILGGCCGSEPAHIRSLTQAVSKLQVPGRDESVKKIRRLTSERKSISFGLDGRFIIVGERINPTGKKKFQQMIREGDFSMVETFVTGQEERGASVLDINMGMSGVDEKETLLKVMEQVTELTSLPLCIDSSAPEVMEAVLRRYPGRALINSVSLEKDRIERMLPLAKKYGAMFILLPVSDEGLPKDQEDKIRIVNEILKKAFDLGLTKEDVIVDGLVGTIGANPQAAKQVLETIGWCRSNELATICGLSNISFGLPERSYVNSAFLTMAIHDGLTCAIANPNQELLTAAMYASDLLMAKEGADIAYIDEMNRRISEGITITKAAPAAVNTAPGSAAKQEQTDSKEKASGVPEDPEAKLLSDVKNCVLKGNRDKVVAAAMQAKEQGINPRRILDEALLTGINEVGALFDSGKYFLPQLIAGAESMKLAIEYLEPFLMEGKNAKSKGCVVIATVEGDIHDIGKNLVALMLKNYGFRVIDLGKDVPKEVIVDTAIKENADIIGLSALMTTTMQQMDNVVKYAREKGCRARIMIGGAVITPDYAEKIGADAYSSDASDAVKVAGKLLEEFLDD